ncbi:AAA domain-containing protein [Kaistella faecalis]|uniref:AAA domain-containing protein n=1 Tax=Kaistella faecalis TaxID=2852098 RepID=UPI001C44894B|nr:AAA domain-containing protein [Chryseobacterium faecale]UFK97735.1 AAA domain-containing protein [Chryseobacterium faecale]
MKDKCIIVFKNGNKEFAYGKHRAKIVKTAISNDKAFSVFNYLKDTAESVGLKTEEGSNILSKSYNSIKHIPADYVLSSFLNGTLPKPIDDVKSNIFPFGFNLSQKDAVNKSFSNNLNVIEGPPGTGKTQTILNIIANTVMNGQSVAIVSSNNSATRNVYEKLEKSGIGFIAAMLGNSQNKKEFIESQLEIPDLTNFKLQKEDQIVLKEQASTLHLELIEYLEQINILAVSRLQLENITTEYHHFQETFKEKLDTFILLKKNLKSSSILAFLIDIENLSRYKSISFFRKFSYRLKYGLKDKSFYKHPVEKMILILQSKYYSTKISELTELIHKLEGSLKIFDFDNKMKEHTKISMQLFKSKLYDKYTLGTRKKYDIPDLKWNSEEFIKDYPVILSTTYSLRNTLSQGITYDYVIIDEASQVDLATGALALSCAKRAVIVGDTKQLPNVVASDIKEKTDAIFDSYELKEAFRYSKHSLLSSVLELFPDVSKTLLREHYRCHPKIIEFCNQKFYGNQLIILTENTSDRSPLIVYRTPPGNHARERMNQRQIDIIKDEIIPNENLKEVDLGIVTPYRNQTFALQQAFNGTSIKADTVDKFQGRENDVIILSTVDNEISEFTDNPNRLNVAVSRAKDQLIVVVNGNESENDSNISDLIKYIEYNNFTVVKSELNSIFDLLYKGYEEQRAELIKKSGKVSQYDSENLMNILIRDVLTEEKFLKYDVVLHLPLRSLIRDFQKLNDEEKIYACNPLTHLDFIIYNKVSKTPVLAIEVDGFEFHKSGTRQAERDQLKDLILEKYNIPLLRFNTNGSNEKARLVRKLNDVQKN